MARSHAVHVRRIYDGRTAHDGARVLVDRLWPRGVAKDRAELDEWCREVAPSNELRTWYGHRCELYDEFRGRYLDELGDPTRAAALQSLRDRHRHGAVTLLTAAKAAEISHAAVLADLLRA